MASALEQYDGIEHAIGSEGYHGCYECITGVCYRGGRGHRSHGVAKGLSRVLGCIQ